MNSLQISKKMKKAKIRFKATSNKKNNWLGKFNKM